MAVAVEYESREAAPEGLRAHLVEKEGKFVFEGESLGEIKNLKSALQKEREAREQYERKLAGLRDIDPDEYKRLRAEAEAAKDKKLIDEGKVEELLAERIARFQKEAEKERSTYQEKLSAAERQLDVLLIDNEIVRLLEGQDGKLRPAAGALEDILLNLRHGSTRLQRQGDAVIAVDAGGKPIYGKDPTRPAGVLDALGELAAKKPHLFQQSSGAGITNERGGGTPPKKKISEMSQPEKDALIAEVGADGYRAMLLAERKMKVAK